MTVGCNATSDPEQAIAVASRIRFALPETRTRALISRAHEMIIALSKNIAQSDNINAAPRRLTLREPFIIYLAPRIEEAALREVVGQAVGVGSGLFVRPAAAVVVAAAVAMGAGSQAECEQERSQPRGAPSDQVD